MKPRTMIAVAATVAIVGGIFALKEYNRDVKGASSMRTAVSVSASELLAAFSTDEDGATARYVGSTEQAIEVSGEIRAIEDAGDGMVTVILETGDALAGIVCEFASADVPVTWRAGASVTVKGVCTGMLMDVVLVRCAPVN